MSPTEAFYKKLTTPAKNWIDDLRPLVLAKKVSVWTLVVLCGSGPLRSRLDISGPSQLPRKVFVQPNTSIVDGEVVLKEYPVTLLGTIESFVERAL